MQARRQHLLHPHGSHLADALQPPAVGRWAGKCHRYHAGQHAAANSWHCCAQHAPYHARPCQRQHRPRHRISPQGPCSLPWHGMRHDHAPCRPCRPCSARATLHGIDTTRTYGLACTSPPSLPLPLHVGRAGLGCKLLSPWTSQLQPSVPSLRLRSIYSIAHPLPSPAAPGPRGLPWCWWWACPCSRRRARTTSATARTRR